MTTPIELLELEVSRREEALRTAREALFKERVRQHQCAVGDIFGGAKGEFKVVGFMTQFGEPTPVALKRLKGGGWGSASHRLHSWTLARLTKTGHEPHDKPRDDGTAIEPGHEPGA